MSKVVYFKNHTSNVQVECGKTMTIGQMGEVESAEVRKLKYRNGSTEMEVEK